MTAARHAWRRVACLHLPLRAASELEKRVRDYKERHAPFRPKSGIRLAAASLVRHAGERQDRAGVGGGTPVRPTARWMCSGPSRADRSVRRGSALPAARRAVLEDDAVAGGQAGGHAGHARDPEAALPASQIAPRAGICARPQERTKPTVVSIHSTAGDAQDVGGSRACRRGRRR